MLEDTAAIILFIMFTFMFFHTVTKDILFALALITIRLLRNIRLWIMPGIRYIFTLELFLLCIKLICIRIFL